MAIVQALSAATDIGRGPLAELVGADLMVPLVQGGWLRYANLDNAASTQALTAVAERIDRVLPTYASVHRGAGFPSQVSTALYERSRQALATFVGCRSDDVLVITRNTTDSLTLLSAAVPAGGEIVVLDIEHHANLLPWQRRDVRCLTAPDTLEQTLVALELELGRRPAALLAITGASNVTGEVTPVAELAAIAHRHGARVAVDAAQLAPHRRIDMAAMDIDYLAFSGHKCYAPFGAGVLAGRRDWLDAAPAHLPGGGAVREVTLGHTDWAAAPQRHEGGTPNLIGAVALAEAVQQIAAIGDPLITAHESALRTRLAAGLEELPGVRILRIFGDATDAVGLVSFTVAGHDSSLIAAALSCEFGIGLRDGRFCAHPLADRLGARAGALRASLGLGSSLGDVERLLDALRVLLREGPRWTYALSGTSWNASPDPRPLPLEADADLSSVPASPCRQ